MESTLTKLQKELKGHGHSYTKSRAMVFQAIEQNGPLSMHRLTAQLRQSVDRASVYRIVALFEELGIVQRLQMGWKYRIELSDQFAEHHHHLSCTRCGNVIEFTENEALEASLKKVAAQYDFALMNHQIELQGICGPCTLLPDIS